jgi:hypothetical protein
MTRRETGGPQGRGTGGPRRAKMQEGERGQEIAGGGGGKRRRGGVDKMQLVKGQAGGAMEEESQRRLSVASEILQCREHVEKNPRGWWVGFWT